MPLTAGRSRSGLYAASDTGLGGGTSSKAWGQKSIQLVLFRCGCPRSCQLFGWLALMGVCGLLADGYHYPKTLGGKPKPVAAFVAWLVKGILLLRVACCTRWTRLALEQLCSGPSFGEFSGGNWNGLKDPVVAHAPGTYWSRRTSASSYLVNYSALI